MMSNKKGMNTGKIENMIYTFILAYVGIIILFNLIGSTIGGLFSAGASACTSGLPLGFLFGSSSAAGWYLLGIAVIAFAFKAFAGFSGGHKK